MTGAGNITVQNLNPFLRVAFKNKFLAFRFE